MAASHLDQRAWVAMVNVSLNAVEVGKSVTGSVTWSNSGKTFAKKVQTPVNGTFVENRILNESELMKHLTRVPPRSVGVLAPNAQYKTLINTPNQVNDVDKGRIAGGWYTYIWGEATYSNVFGQHHKTTFCSVRQGVTDEFLQCPFYNDAD